MVVEAGVVPAPRKANMRTAHDAECICSDTDPYAIGHDDACVQFYLHHYADRDTRTSPPRGALSYKELVW